MKKILSFAMMACLSMSTILDAQSKKFWDFTAGLSDTDRENLTADATNWITNEEGEKAYWQDNKKLSGTLMANGQVLEFTEGLTVGTAGLSSNKNFKVGPKAFRMARKNMEFHLPKLANGQVVTVVARSANSTATDRGIKGNSNMTYVSGPEGGICLGSQAAGASEDGNYTLVWNVTTDSADSVDVALIMITGGLDIQSIMIDNGDEPVIESDPTVAYIYDGSYNNGKEFGWNFNGGLDSDPVYNVLQSYDVTPIDLNGQALTPAELNDSLLKFDVVVLGEAVSSGNSHAKAVFDIVNKVPMLNLKSFMYKSGVWGVGAGSNPSPKATTIKVGEDYLDHPLFADLASLDDEGNITLFDCEDVSEIAGGNLVQGYTTSAGSLFENDEVLATVGDGINAIHVHGTKNQYMLIPISSDNMDKAAEDLYTIVYNAVSILAQTKSKVQNVSTPSISQVAENGVTTVSISCPTSGATIFYTVDGTEPTEASPVYAEAFDVTTDGLVVKAFATAHGYNPSAVATAVISVKSKSADPTITLEGAAGQTTITIAQAEGTPIYYSFSGVTDKAQAALYTEPVVVKEPGTIYAFAASDASLQSELVSAEFTVGGIPAVKDTLAHYNAGEEDWFTNAVLHVGGVDSLLTEAIPVGAFGASGSAKAVYYFSKNAWSCYSSEEDHRETVTGSEGQDSVVYYYKLDPAALKTITSNTNPDWIIKTMGQVVTGETTAKDCAPLLGVGNGTVGRYAESAIDEIGSRPTPGFTDFGGKPSGEPYSLSFETTGKYAGDIDIVTYIGNGSTGEPVIVLQTSLDGENWQTADTLNVTNKQRYYKKTRLHYNFADASYLRVTQVGGSSKAYIYDIYIIRTEGTTGIEAINSDREAAASLVFDLQGRQVTAPVRGHLYIQNGKKFILK